MFAVLERLCSFFTKGANIDEASQFENRIIPRSAIKSGYKPQIKILCTIEANPCLHFNTLYSPNLSIRAGSNWTQVLILLRNFPNGSI